MGAKKRQERKYHVTSHILPPVVPPLGYLGCTCITLPHGLGCPAVQGMSPAQQTMRSDVAAAQSELSREGHLMSRSEVIVDNILTGAPKKLRLHPSDWAQVRQLVRQAVLEGRELERDA